MMRTCRVLIFQRNRLGEMGLSQQSGCVFFFGTSTLSSGKKRPGNGGNGVFCNRLMGLKCFIFEDPTATSSFESHVSWIFHGLLLPGTR